MSVTRVHYSREVYSGFEYNAAFTRYILNDIVHSRLHGGIAVICETQTLCEAMASTLCNALNNMFGITACQKRRNDLYFDTDNERYFIDCVTPCYEHLARNLDPRHIYIYTLRGVKRDDFRKNVEPVMLSHNIQTHLSWPDDEWNEVQARVQDIYEDTSGETGVAWRDEDLRPGFTQSQQILLR